MDSQALLLPTCWAEGFPTVLAEAMSFGLPIVTTRARGAADHLEPDINALFVPAEDPAAIAAAVARLAARPAEAAAMGAANLEAVAAFAPERVAPEYLAALSGLWAAAGADVPVPSVAGDPS